MLFAGVILGTLGIIGLIWGIMQKLKAGRVADAPLVKTGDAAQKGTAVAGARGAISVQGAVRCEQPLIAPMTGTPCLFYELKAFAVWKEGDAQKSKELHKDKQAARFSVDDGSGPVWVDAHEGGDFDPTQRKEQTQGTGIIGGITGTELSFGNFKLATGMLTLGSGTKYRVEESILPVQQQLYVCGKAADGGGSITAPSWRALLLSHMTRDQLLGSATKTAKMGIFGGGAAVATGVILTVVGQLLAGGSAAGKATTDTTAASAKAGASSTGAAAEVDPTTAEAPAANAAHSTATPTGAVPTPAKGAASAVAAAHSGGSAEKAPAAAGAYKVGDHVNIDWKGSLYPGTIIATPGKDSYKVHYDGYAASWDEAVGPARLKGKL
jgi:hypothetical protein